MEGRGGGGGEGGTGGYLQGRMEGLPSGDALPQELLLLSGCEPRYQFFLRAQSCSPQSLLPPNDHASAGAYQGGGVYHMHTHHAIYMVYIHDGPVWKQTRSVRQPSRLVW